LKYFVPNAPSFAVPDMSYVLVETDAELSALIADLSRCAGIAVDTESNSLFAYRERVCVIQFSTPAADYVVDTLAFADLSALGPIFADPQVEKVFHGADYDVSTLRRDYGFHFAGLFDTMIASRILGIKQFGLSNLLEARFGVVLDKRMQRHDWGRRPLQRDALEYARLDTHYLLPLRDQLATELGETQREREAREAFARVAQAEWTRRPFEPGDFWRIKGALDLDDVGRGALKALAVWREAQASRLDRPPFKVLSDQMLAELAGSRPSTPRELEAMPGLNRSQAHAWSEGILHAIAAGQRHPQRLTSRPTGEERPDPALLERYERLRRWRKARAALRNVEPDVLISNGALMELARRRPADLESLQRLDLLAETQLENYGAELLAALAEG
jgi:ribonuclease D